MQDRNFSEYIFYNKTYFVEPKIYGQKVYTRVVEADREFLIPCKPLDIIKASCNYYGSSFKGRLEGSNHVIGKKHKTPIALESNLFIFPTTSPSRSNCFWVNEQHVLNQVAHASDSTAVTFKNNRTYLLPISERSFKNQWFTASHLRNKCRQRIYDLENNKVQFYYPDTNIIEEKGEYGE
ncbi:competence protein ComK [Pseudoneobacillus sp. C159]